MAAHDERAAGPLPEPDRECRDVVDDVGQSDFGAQPIIGNGDGDPMQLEPAGDMAELRLVQRSPVAAMDEHHDPAAGIVLGVEDIAGLERVPAIGKVELAPHAGTECRGIAAPAIDDRLVVGDASAVVVLPVEIHGAGTMPDAAGSAKFRLLESRACVRPSPVSDRSPRAGRSREPAPRWPFRLRSGFEDSSRMPGWCAGPWPAAARYQQ